MAMSLVFFWVGAAKTIFWVDPVKDCGCVYDERLELQALRPGSD